MMDIREYKNGNITIKPETIPENADFFTMVYSIASGLDWNDTYLISDFYCIGNDCMGVTFYNVRTNKVFFVNSYQVDKYLLSGRTLRMYANVPDASDLELINEWEAR